MATYDFTLILTSPIELTEEFGEKLFSAGCDDCTPSSCQGTVAIDFSRDSTDLQSAIRSAIANVSAAGGVVDRVEIDADTPLFEGLGTLDDLFRVLMGDQVEPRREFIKKHALDVRNLDV